MGYSTFLKSRVWGLLAAAECRGVTRSVPSHDTSARRRRLTTNLPYFPAITARATITRMISLVPSKI